MRFILGVLIMLSAFFVGSRLQVNEHATFVTKSGEVIEGRVAREFVSGDYVIKQADHSTRFVSYDDFGAMTYEGSGVPWYAGALGFLLLFIGLCVGCGVDKWLVKRYFARGQRRAG